MKEYVKKIKDFTGETLDALDGIECSYKTEFQNTPFRTPNKLTERLAATLDIIESSYN